MAANDNSAPKGAAEGLSEATSPESVADRFLIHYEIALAWVCVVGRRRWPNHPVSDVDWATSIAAWEIAGGGW